jgi:hypothetical protein
MKLRLFCVAVAVLLLPRPVLGCTMALSGPPQSALDRREYIFGGRVLGYVGPYSARGVEGEVWGLRVRIIKSVYIPRAVREVELFHYDLGSDCSTLGMSRQWLERGYPTGTDVLVFAWPAMAVESHDGAVHLESSWSQGGVVRSPMGLREVIGRTVDYAAAYKLSRDEFNDRFGPATTVMDFELQKEFVRLARTSARTKVKILERVMFHPYAPFDLMVRANLGSSPAAMRLVDEWHQRHGGRSGR